MKKTITYYILVAFVLNFVWEMAHAGLYGPHFEGVSDFILVHFRAALGDVLIFLLIYLICALVYKDKDWIKMREIDFSVYALVSFLGFIIAIAIEKYALFTQRWFYNELMPILPVVQVGLTPILQLTILAPLTVFLVRIKSV